MKLATPSEMRKLDDLAIEKYKIPGILLMENAAQSVARKACEMLSHDKSKRIIVVAGKGNNGGDGFAAARHLFQWGYSVSVLSLVVKGSITGDAKVFLQIIENLGIVITYAGKEGLTPEIRKDLNDAAIIIDGIFGTGIHGEVTGFFAEAIQAINASKARVISVDIPSGISGKTGQVCGTAVKADETVTFSLPKPGLWQYPGRAHAARVTVADIGIPVGAIKEMVLRGEILDSLSVLNGLPERVPDGHKGTFGKLFIITGSTGMTGAGALAAKAAFKTGSGLVYLAVPKSLSTIYGITMPEAIIIPLEDCEGMITAGNVKVLLKASAAMDAVVIGPGLSAAQEVAGWVGKFVVGCPKPMVIDADALNVITPEILKQRKKPTIITPHPGEFSRLSGYATDQIQKNRVEIAVEFSQQYGCIVVLKGAGTVIACPDGRYSINPTGHACLAVAGSGDVLAGMAGSLLGQGASDEHAARLAAFIHGRCGEALAAEQNNQAGCVSSEICGKIPYVIGAMKLEVQKVKEGSIVEYETKQSMGRN